MEAPVNAELIDELKDLMGTDFVTLLDTYIQDSQHRLLTIEVAIAEGDADSIVSHAHSLKGSSANVGAYLVEQSCANVVVLAREGNINGVDDLYPELLSRYQSVSRYFRQLQ